MQIGTKQFQFDGHHVYVMGILNVTPDSFSDGGKFNHLDQALAHVEEMVAQGADIIDIGGESTRPGYQKITVEEEIERVTEVIRKVKERFDVPVSLDTYKAPVMDAGLQVQTWQMIYGDCVMMSYLHRKAANLFGRSVRWRRSSQNTTNRSALCIIVQKQNMGIF